MTVAFDCHIETATTLSTEPAKNILIGNFACIFNLCATYAARPRLAMPSIGARTQVEPVTDSTIGLTWPTS